MLEGILFYPKRPNGQRPKNGRQELGQRSPNIAGIKIKQEKINDGSYKSSPEPY